MSPPDAPQARPHTGRVFLWIIGLVVAAAYIGGAAFHVAYGPMNSDEGFYAVAARAVAQGEMPYRDFGFTQPPLIAYVNAPLLHFAGFGLFQQRAVNGLWGLLALLVAARTVRRHTGTLAAMLLVALFATSPAWMYFTNLGKTYGLTSLLVAVATAVFLEAQPGWRKSVILSVIAVLGIACRLPAAPFFGIIWLAALWDGRRPTIGHVAIALVALVIGASAVALPFYLSAAEQTKFWVLDFHRISVPMKTWRLTWNDFIGLAPAIWIIAAVGVFVSVKSRQSWRREYIVIIAALVALGFNLLPRGVYDEYGVPFLPPLAVASFLLLAPAIARWPGPKLVTLACALVLASLVIIPTVNWSRLTPLHRRLPSLWMPATSQPYNFSLPNDLRQARAAVAQLLPPGALFIGPNLILATETGHPIPRTMRMGPFSFTSDYDAQKADRLHLMTQADFEQHLMDYKVVLLGLHTEKVYNYVWSMPSFTIHSTEGLRRWGELVARNFVPVYGDHDFELLARPHILPPLPAR